MYKTCEGFTEAQITVFSEAKNVSKCTHITMTNPHLSYQTHHHPPNLEHMLA